MLIPIGADEHIDYREQAFEEVIKQAEKLNVNVSSLLVQSNGEDMNTLKELLENGVSDCINI